MNWLKCNSTPFPSFSVHSYMETLKGSASVKISYHPSTIRLQLNDISIPAQLLLLLVKNTNLCLCRDS